jgi:hypothetical protein
VLYERSSSSLPTAAARMHFEESVIPPERKRNPKRGQSLPTQPANEGKEKVISAIYTKFRGSTFEGGCCAAGEPEHRNSPAWELQTSAGPPFIETKHSFLSPLQGTVKILEPWRILAISEKHDQLFMAGDKSPMGYGQKYEKKKKKKS